MANIAVIVGGGKGTRIGKEVNKILLSLNEKPMLCHTIERFENCKNIDSIILVINKEDIVEIKDIIKDCDYKKIKDIVPGGKERQDSVYNGLKAIKDADNNDIVLIHNAANPFVSEQTINEIIKAAEKHGSAVAGVRAKDTIKEVDENNLVVKTLERKRLWQMQTPQAIKYNIAVEAFKKAYDDNFYATDDVSLVERIEKKVAVVETNPENIKVTTTDDLDSAQIGLSARAGIGQDSHMFEDKVKKPLVLGGFIIPGETGLKANSDGDVILHALFNALSQAIGLRSIGCYADKMCLEQGINDSREYVKFILKKLKEKDYIINNIGIMIEAKRPKLEPHHDDIKNSIAKLLEIKTDQIGITFTTGEDLTEFGKGNGIQCFCTTVLSKK